MGNPWAYDFSAIGARNSPLLVVIGSDRELVAKAQGGFGLEGTSDIYKLLPDTFHFEQLNLSRQFLKQPPPDLSRHDCVLNLITDADLHPRTLERLRKLLRGYRGRVINRPEAVLRSTRDQVAKLLSGVPGLRVPKVIRLRGGRGDAAVQAVDRAGMAYPLIVRRTGTHTGQIIGIVEGPAQLRTALQADGDHFATEFLSLRGPDGLFRKYRVYFFGPRVIFRNQYLSDQWNVHSKDHQRCLAERPELVEQLDAMFARPEGAFPDFMAGVFAEIRKRMPQQFFGMDFGFAPEGEAVLFEANATMSFVPSWPDGQFRHCLPAARQAFLEMLGMPVQEMQLRASE